MRGSFAFLRTAVSVLIVLFLLIPPTQGAAEDVDKAHRKAVELARSGQHEQALERLAPLAANAASDAPVRYDYITVLSWAGKDEQATAEAAHMDTAAAPAYVLEALAQSARNLGRPSQAVDFYEHALRKDPEQLELRLGLALSLTDAGHGSKALTMLAALEESVPEEDHENRVRVGFATAYVHESNADPAQALGVYQRLLEEFPENSEVLRRLIMTANQLGAHHVAAEMAERHPNLLSPEEFARVNADRAAITLRWGRLSPDTPEERYDETDRALGLMEQNVRTARQSGNVQAQRQARFDRLVALTDRQRMAEAIAEYEALVAEGASVPTHALSAVGDAYWALEKPEIAQALFLRVIEAEPDNFDAHVKLAYAYLDMGRFNRAFRVADALAEAQPEQLGQPGSRVVKDNPRKLEADMLAAMMRAFSDRLAEAQARLETLFAGHPDDQDIRSELANIYYWRGWSRRALAEFELGLASGSSHQGLAEGRARMLLDLDRLDAAERDITTLAASHPDDLQVNRLSRDLATRNLRELIVTANGDKSSGTALGSSSTTVDAVLYSAPVRHRYRGFVHTYVSRANFPQGTETLSRLGAGLEYHHRGLRLTAEGHGDRNGGRHGGVALSADQELGDTLSVSVAYDSFSSRIPLQALLFNTETRWTNFTLNWHPNESRQILAGFDSYSFSDGNRRKSSLLSWRERWYTGAHYRFATELEASTSSNSVIGAPYFNPYEDSSLSVTLVNEWQVSRRLFRLYERSFTHGIDLTGGRYQQTGFETKATGKVRYHHRWRVHDRLEIAYGIGHAANVYDGVREKANSADLSVNWRF